MHEGVHNDSEVEKYDTYETRVITKHSKQKISCMGYRKVQSKLMSIGSDSYMDKACSQTNYSYSVLQRSKYIIPV